MKFFYLCKRLLVPFMTAASLFSYTTTVHAYGLTQCAASRYGSNLNCTANDVYLTNMRVVGDTASCIGGTSVTLGLEMTVNFQNPSRYDIGIFISNDGKSPQSLPASGGANSCSVSVLPNSSPFMNLDGPTDTCGDGKDSITGIHYMPNTTVLCQSLAGAGGNLYIPFVVSWDQQSTPPGAICTSAADPVPGASSKCNAPTIVQGTVSVVVLPTITNTDGIAFIQSGNSATYSVVITNTTGATLSGAVLTDPAVTGIDVTGLICSAAGGASCPASYTIADMQGSGITIPNMPANGSVTFTITAILTGNPSDTRTNIASVTVGGQTNSASDTDTIVGAIAIIPTSISQPGSPGTLMVYNYTLYNFSGVADTVNLNASSSQGWTVTIKDAGDTTTISSLSVAAPVGSSANFIAKVQIPGGATVGTVDTTTIDAISGNNPGNTASATAITTVSNPLTFTPNNTGSGGKNSSVFYNHRVQNNTASTQTVTFSQAFSGSCGSWTAGVYKSDGATQIPPATVTLAPFGGYEDIVVKVNVPSGAVTGSTCTVTTTATTNPGGNSASATDETTVKALILYSDGGYTDESYIFPTGNYVYAKAYGAASATYKFCWYDSSNTLRRISPNRTGPGTLPDTGPLSNTDPPSPIPGAGPLGTWRVEVRQTNCSGALFASTNFYVGPDHVYADYTGPTAHVNTNITIDLALHGKDHAVPVASGNLVKGSPPDTKDPLKITVTVSGSASIVSTTLSGAVITGQTVTGILSDTTGTATITITDSMAETVTVTPASYNGALYGSPARDEAATVTFVIRKMRILYWQEVY